MTPRSLFNIILKVLGLFFIKDILATIPQIVSYSILLTETKVSEVIWLLVGAVLTVAFSGILSYYLIFRSGLIIDKLSLDKDFDQAAIPLTIHRSIILSIAIIIVGGLVLADEIPNFCRQ